MDSREELVREKLEKTTGMIVRKKPGPKPKVPVADAPLRSPALKAVWANVGAMLQTMAQRRYNVSHTQIDIARNVFYVMFSYDPQMEKSYLGIADADGWYVTPDVIGLPNLDGKTGLPQ